MAAGFSCSEPMAPAMILVTVVSLVKKVGDSGDDCLCADRNLETRFDPWGSNGEGFRQAIWNRDYC